MDPITFSLSMSGTQALVWLLAAFAVGFVVGYLLDGANED